MKHLFFSGLMLLSLTTLAQSLPGDQDLVAYYPFNGTPADASGNGHNGTVFGATLSADRYGNPNSAYTFDGTDDYIDLGAMNYDPTLSVWMGWINCTANPTDKVTLYSGYDGTQQLVISVQQGVIEVVYSRNISTTETATTGGTVLPYNTWTHLAVEVGTDLEVFINGSKLSDINIPTNGLDEITESYLGVEKSTNQQWFTGSLDDVRIYNDRLADTTILAIYNFESQNLGNNNSLYWTKDNDDLFYEAGRVRIGDVTTPTGYQLYVEEGILTEKLKISLKSTGEWADFVFEDDYTLPGLSEVDHFIQQQGHLPGIPSASEAVEQGLDVVQMNAKLLQKIEELTLYLIDQEKRLAAIEQENQRFRTVIKKLKTDEND